MYRASLRRLAATGLAALALASASTLVAAPAQASTRPLFQLPFSCGEHWRFSTHADHVYGAIDMNWQDGIDDGHPILASFGGTVSDVGLGSRSGYFIKINHGGGWTSQYHHLKENAWVSVGTTVARGQQIGRVGSTGNSSGPHLHYEQKYNGNNVESLFNGVPSGITSETSPTTYRTSANCLGVVKIYGVISGGNLTYSEVQATGVRSLGAIVSTATLGFTPKAIATLNDNTVLITGGGNLYRIDITSKNPLTFNIPVLIAGGWTHDLLAYDGNGHLYGIAAGTLRRYDITTPKPPVGIVPGNTVIGGGFNLKTLTATGPGWILGTTADGRLRSYKINLDGSWTGYTLRETSWDVFDTMISGSGRVFFGHKPDGSLYHYTDEHPYDGSSTDLHIHNAVDTHGWTQTLLSAQPGTTN